MEDITHDEFSAINNNNHGWQKVTYAKKRNNQQNKQHKAAAAAAAAISAVGFGDDDHIANVFRAIDQHSEDRHRRIVEAQKKSLTELDDYVKPPPRSSRSKKRLDDSDDTGDSDLEDRDNGGEAPIQEEKKKKKPKAEKKPKVTVAEAAAKIDAENLVAFLLDISGTYRSQEDIQLMRFGDYFGRAFSGVSSAQFPWVKTFKESPVAKIVDIPISHVPEAVYRTSFDWISQRSVAALSSFALLLLDSILADLGNQLASVKNGKKASQQQPSKSQVAIFTVLGMVLRRKPDVLLGILPTLRDNSKYQGQDKVPVLVWMISQASLGDLAVGLCAWAHNLLPMLTSKSTNNPLNRDLILQLVERILAAPKARSILVSGAVRKGERLIPPAELEILLRVTFRVSSARVKATERFEAVYPTLKEVALAGEPGSKAMKQVSQQIFAFAIAAAGEGNSELAKEATNIVLWSLNQNSDIYKHWDKIYLDNLEASVAILKNLSEHVKEQQLSQSSLEVVKQTLKSFQQKNEKALSGKSGAQQALLKDADKYAKAILGRLSRSHGCLKAFVFTGIVRAAAAAVISSNGDTFDWKSVTETVDWKSVSETFYLKRVTAMLSSFQSA